MKPLGPVTRTRGAILDNRVENFGARRIGGLEFKEWEVGWTRLKYGSLKYAERSATATGYERKMSISKHNYRSQYHHLKR